MSTFSVAEAQMRLREIIDNLAPGEEVVLVDNERPVARIVGEPAPRPTRPPPGLGKGSIVYMAPDFDEPLEEFREYLE
jgi:antitoxin (DNA-binding transcriptional repressor) of toxin-antitoxin stability system